MTLEHKDELRSFLSAIWGDDPATVFLAYKSSATAFEIPNAQQWPEKADLISKWALGHSARGHEVYYSMATYEPGAPGKRKEFAEESRALWVDLDGNAEGALASLGLLGLPAPSYRISSGRDGHEHWYWILDAPRPAQDVEAMNRRIAYALDGDKACWAIDHVLRLPFTKNHMIGKEDRLKPGQKPPFPVDFISVNEESFTLDRFDKLPKVKDSIAEGLTLGDIPDVEEVVRKYKWDKKHFDIFKVSDQDMVKDRDNHYMAMAYWCAEKGMTAEEIFSVVQDLDTRLGKFVNRSDRMRRLTEMVSKAVAKHPFVPVPENSVDEDIKTIYSLSELLNAEFHIEWLIDGFIPKRTINFLSAQSGIGKSRLSLNLGLECARGGQFLNWKIENKMKVLYLSFEMEATMLKHFAEALMDGDELRPDDENFMFVPVGQAIDLSTEEGKEFVRSAIEETGADLVFIDAMGSLTFDELGETQAKGINNTLKEFIKNYEATFFIIHHNKKPSESNKRPTMADVYGSQYVLTEAATALTMYMENDQSNIELIPIKTRAGQAPDVVRLNGKKGFRFEVREGGYFDDDTSKFEDIV